MNEATCIGMEEAFGLSKLRDEHLHRISKDTGPGYNEDKFTAAPISVLFREEFEQMRGEYARMFEATVNT